MAISKDASQYAHLRPDELQDRLEARPVAIVPWGALEWHSVHLPVGLDGLVATSVAHQLSERTGAVVLPPFYLPITALSHRFSLTFSSRLVQEVVDELLGELARAGFRVVLLLSGHYAQAHELVMMAAAEEAWEKHGTLVLATPPLAVLDEDMLDHAGHWETSALLATAPDLVDLPRLAEARTAQPGADPAQLGVLGRLPDASTTAEAGETAISAAVEKLAMLTEILLEANDATPLREFYGRRRAAYKPFLDRYFDGSWEVAAARWWEDRSGSKASGVGDQSETSGPETE